MAAGHGFDDEGRTCGCIPGGKDAGTSRGQSVRVDSNGRLFGNPHAGTFWDESQTSPLPHGKDNAVTGNKMLSVWNGHRAEATGTIGQTLFGAHALHPHYFFVVISDNLHRGNLEMKIDSLILSVAHFQFSPRRLLAGAPVVNLDLRALSYGSAGHVHSYVPGPDDGNLLPQRGRVAQADIA